MGEARPRGNLLPASVSYRVVDHNRDGPYMAGIPDLGAAPATVAIPENGGNFR